MYNFMDLFLKENRELVIECVITKDKNSFKTLNKKFSNFLYRIYLLSYINKSIVYTAMELKKRHTLLKSTEQATLNILHNDFKDELINLLPAESVDYVEEVINGKSYIDFTEIFTSKKIINAINELGDRQKEVLYMKYVRNIPEGIIASRLNITKQSVNKSKKTALQKIRNVLSG